MTETVEPDNPAAYALARHIADHPVSTIQAAFRYLNAPVTIGLHEPAVVPSAPVARTALRDRIAAAIWERQNPGRRWADCEYRWRADAEADADAMLAVLPAPADRAAVLREAIARVDVLEAEAWAGAESEEHIGRATGVGNAKSELRRMADEAQQPTSTAPLAAGLPLVQGRCPACNGASLFLGDGGYVTCSRIDCPEPDAASTALEQPADEAQQPECAASISGRCLAEAQSETACDTGAGECVHGGRTTDGARQAEAEPCGAWGGCTLARGHNIGQADIPENHRAPQPAVGARQADTAGEQPAT